MARLQQRDYVQVKTISKKMLSQIVCPMYNGPVFQRLHNAMETDAVKRLGWVKKEFVEKPCNEKGHPVYFAATFLHLVEWDGQLFFMPCNDTWNATMDDAGPQLFVGV